MTMVKTGSEIFTVLSILATLAPLLPILILIIRQAPPDPTLHLLRIVCLVVFVQNLAISIPALTAVYLPFISAIFRLAELSLLYYLFVQAALPKRLREIMTLLLVSFVSVIITVYAFRGADAFPTTVTAIESSVLIILALVALLRLIGNRGIVLFREPLFWIAGGVICYFGTYLFIETITRVRIGLSQDINEKLVVFWIAGISRFIFFAIAAFVAPAKRNDIY
jgi:hypothetical protein